MRYPFLMVTLLTAPLIACATDDKANEPEKLETLDQKASYGFGVDFANRLKQQGIILDSKALTRGISDAADGKQLALPEEEMAKARTTFLQNLQTKLAAEQKAQAEKNLADGQAFLAENGKKEGVVTTESGLQYKIITEGTGATPKAEDTVVTHYRGTVIDGREFDSSYKRGKPATFPVKGVIKGWTEALQLMKVGAKWELYIPSELAYGETKRSEVIEANSTLIFELELLEIK